MASACLTGDQNYWVLTYLQVRTGEGWYPKWHIFYNTFSKTCSNILATNTTSPMMKIRTGTGHELGMHVNFFPPVLLWKISGDSEEGNSLHCTSQPPWRLKTVALTFPEVIQEEIRMPHSPSVVCLVWSFPASGSSIFPISRTRARFLVPVVKLLFAWGLLLFTTSVYLFPHLGLINCCYSFSLLSLPYHWKTTSKQAIKQNGGAHVVGVRRSSAMISSTMRANLILIQLLTSITDHVQQKFL